MKLAVVLGGSGYIGSFLIQRFIQTDRFDKIIIVDLEPPGTYLNNQDSPCVEYIHGDVRKPINIGALPDIRTDDSWIFNLAAVHREPGHHFREYFDTNIPGAEHAVELALKTRISNIFFTSSIAPYGRSYSERTEKSELYPETGYGISKALAEKVHQNWAAGNSNRRLIIVRPSVIYGPHDPGNVLRMIRALKKGAFILPNGGRIIKAYGYIYGLVDSVLFTMKMNKSLIVYNYAEYPLIPLDAMAATVKKKFRYHRPTLKMSVRVLASIAGIISIGSKVFGKKSDIHPVRVRKAGFPTNIHPGFLIEHGFPFNYNFETSLNHWEELAPEDFN